jgi:hypothetical protein
MIEHDSLSDRIDAAVDRVVDMTKRFTLRRVGAGPGSAVFECSQLLGAEVVVVDAADYDAALKRIAELEEELHLAIEDDRGVL